MPDQEPIRWQQEFKTTNMVLAALLKMRDFECLRLTIDADTNEATWVYRDEPPLVELVDEFREGDTLVEPTEFSRKLGWVRSDLYRKMGHNKQPKGTRVQPGAAS